MPKVKEIIGLIEEIAKPEYAYGWDNSGFACGNANEEADKVLVTLDITKEVVREAEQKGCQMIISHHPLIFKPIKTASEDTYEGEVLSKLFKSGIALYCAHTSLDIALGGVNDALAHKLKLKNVRLLNSEFSPKGEEISCGRVGDTEKTFKKEEFIDFLKEQTGAKHILHSCLPENINTVALCTGAGEDMAFLCKDAEVFVTGEVKYHTALELKRQNTAFIAIGHYYSEIHSVNYLCDGLQKRADVLQYKISFIPTETVTDPFD